MRGDFGCALILCLAIAMTIAGFALMSFGGV